MAVIDLKQVIAYPNLCETNALCDDCRVVNRLCMESCTVGGIHIPAGVTVQADVWSIHNNPDTWGPTHPSVFEPERYVIKGVVS